MFWKWRVDLRWSKGYKVKDQGQIKKIILNLLTLYFIEVTQGKYAINAVEINIFLTHKKSGRWEDLSRRISLLVFEFRLVNRP